VAKTVSEQIQAFEAKLKALEDSALDIVQKSIDEARTLDKSEEEARQNAVSEAKTVREHIAVLKQTEQLMLARAATVNPDAGQAGAGDLGTKGVDIGNVGTIRVASNLEKGVEFARFALSMAMAKGNVMQAHEIAKANFKDSPRVINALQAAISIGGTKELHEKAAVVFGTTTSTDFVGPLVQYNDMEREFIELLRPKSIIGRLTNLHRVPFMSRMGRQLTGVSGSFVGEGAPKPVGKQTYDTKTLGFAKAAIIVVLSDEAVRFSNPNAATLARDDMVKGINTYLDKRFVDPNYSGVANVSPASISNGAPRVQSSGTTVAAIQTDVRATMVAAGFTADVDPATAVWIMPAAVALRLAMKLNTNDEPAFPGISLTGGTFMGLPVIISNSMIASGSPAELQILLVTQSEVLMADDGGVSLDMSMEASVQLDDAPSAGAQSLVSLWQNNLVGIRAERYINWSAARASNLGIALLENINY
jgi:HK97 family phage major capsid protein